jgi:hypothetical protein
MTSVKRRCASASIVVLERRISPLLIVDDARANLPRQSDEAKT